MSEHSGTVEVESGTVEVERWPCSTDLTPAEKLATGKKRPSALKFSNMPWTGWPLILKEILGTLRSRQQLTTSSALRTCWLGEFTVRGMQPAQSTQTCGSTVARRRNV